MSSMGQECLSHFDVLPLEIVTEIMTNLTVKERLSFMSAYPKFNELGQVSTLKTRTITQSSAKMNTKELKSVLDHNGKEIKVSLDKSDALFRTTLLLDVFHLMPQLEDITLNSCHLLFHTCIKMCPPEWVTSCRTHCWFWHKLLTSAKAITFQSCTQSEEDASLAWEAWIAIFERYIFGEGSESTLREVTFSNTLSVVDLCELTLCFRAWVSWEVFSFQKEPIPLEVENLEGEILEIGTIPLEPQLDNLNYDRSLKMGIKALYRTMSWPCELDNDPDPWLHLLAPVKSYHGRLCTKIKFWLDGSGIRRIRITENFNMSKLRSELRNEGRRLVPYS